MVRDPLAWLAGWLSASLALILILNLPAVAGGPGTAAPIAPPESFTPEQREHWAYQPPARPELPAVKDAAGSSNPIDRFILAGLEEGRLPARARGRSDRR